MENLRRGISSIKQLTFSIQEKLNIVVQKLNCKNVTSEKSVEFIKRNFSYSMEKNKNSVIIKSR